MTYKGRKMVYLPSYIRRPVSSLQEPISIADRRTRDGEVFQTVKMENGHRYEDEGEEIADEETPSEPDEQPSKSSSPVSVVMPGTSTSDAEGHPAVYDEPILLDSSDEVYCTDDGDEADDDDTSDDQHRDLTVTFRSEETNEEIATATLIVKRHDPVETFLPFVGALLRSIQSEQMKLRLMEEISQILINAKTEEIQRHRRPRLQ